MSTNNANYSGLVSRVQSQPKPLPGLDNLRALSICGAQVLVGKEVEEGQLGVYFPPGSQLSTRFLHSNNLYSSSQLNMDKEQKGYFGDNGRVRAIRLRGHISEGVWFPISTLYTAYPFARPFLEGDTIDIIGEEQVCWKYELPEKFFPSPNSRPRVSSRSLQVKEMLANGGFELHYDTPQLRYHPNAVRPSDMVEITDKWHGTSIVVGKPLIPRRLSFMEKVKNYLWTRFGWEWALVCTHEYALAWASRRVVKGIEGLYTSSTDHYYGEDLWGQVAHEIAPKIPNGYVVYGEVVGYTLSGKQIQPGYTYGCKPGKHKFAAYRMTRKSFVGGGILEIPCGHFGLGLDTVPLLKTRIASELLPLLAGETEEEWQVRFHSWLRETFVRDQDCPYNSPGTPSEGIVIRVIPRELWDSGAHFPRSARGYGVYKLKNPRFLLRETENADLGVEGVEG